MKIQPAPGAALIRPAAYAAVSLTLDITLNAGLYTDDVHTMAAHTLAGEVERLIQDSRTLAELNYGNDFAVPTEVGLAAEEWRSPVNGTPPSFLTVRLAFDVVLDGEKWQRLWGIPASRSLAMHVAHELGARADFRRWRATVDVVPHLSGQLHGTTKYTTGRVEPVRTRLGDAEPATAEVVPDTLP
jgi:hypothetical protein